MLNTRDRGPQGGGSILGRFLVITAEETRWRARSRISVQLVSLTGEHMLCKLLQELQGGSILFSNLLSEY